MYNEQVSVPYEKQQYINVTECIVYMFRAMTL